MSFTPPRPPGKTETIEANRYATKKPGIGRLLLGFLAFVWAVIFCGLAVMRADFSRPGTLIWSLILALLAVASAYGGLLVVTSWWASRK